MTDAAFYMLLFIALSLICTYAMLVSRSLTIGISGGVFGIIFWLVSAQYWLHLNTTTASIAYLFYAGSVFCLVWTGYSSFRTFQGGRRR